MRLVVLNHSVGKLSAAYEEIHGQRAVLEDRVVRLRPSSIDPDFLEERARYVLGYVHPDETVLLRL